MSEDNLTQINMNDFKKDMNNSFKKFDEFLEKTEHIWTKQKEKDIYRTFYEKNKLYPYLKNNINYK
jgi:hypothetical protein